jgi:FkbM family methyltransferase
LTRSSKFLDLFRQRLENQITREHYWTQIRCFLEELSEFSELQGILGNKIEISSNKIIVDIQISKTHQNRIQMFLDEQDIRSVPFSILADGFYEPFQSDILIELGKVSNHFLDIGANMGFYSIALSAENATLTVESFEPQPNVFEILTSNINLNEFRSRIHPHNTGVGTSKEEITMFIPRFTGTGGASFKNLHNDEGESIQIKVPVDALDDLIKVEPDLIKIDVEGSELNVLKGGARTIKLSKPTVVVELLRKWMKPFGHTPQMFLNIMLEQNYRCYAISKDHLYEIHKIDDSTTETNFIFVHDLQEEHKVILNRYTK